MENLKLTYKWNIHDEFEKLFETNTLVDCTLAAEGQYLKAHRVVLASCSSYFELLFSQQEDKHPIVILKDVKFEELKAVLHFIYKGEVLISERELETFLEVAESLKIRGLKHHKKECLTNRKPASSLDIVPDQKILNKNVSKIEECEKNDTQEKYNFTLNPSLEKYIDMHSTIVSKRKDHSPQINVGTIIQANKLPRIEVVTVKQELEFEESENNIDNDSTICEEHLSERLEVRSCETPSSSEAYCFQSKTYLSDAEGAIGTEHNDSVCGFNRANNSAESFPDLNTPTLSVRDHQLSFGTEMNVLLSNEIDIKEEILSEVHLESVNESIANPYLNDEVQNFNEEHTYDISMSPAFSHSISAEAPQQPEMAEEWIPTEILKEAEEAVGKLNPEKSSPRSRNRIPSLGDHLHQVSEKSKERYMKEWYTFKDWQRENKIFEISEVVMLAYFNQKSKTFKSSTLWSVYSMLKSTMKVEENIDMSKFSKLTAFLKQINLGYEPKKVKTLTREQLNKFLLEAPDKNYLMIKVATLIGVAGACRREELYNMSVDDVEESDSVLVFHIRNPETFKSRMFTIIPDGSVNQIDIFKKYISLRPKHVTHKKLFLFYCNGKCSVQPVGIHTFAKMPKIIAEYLGLPDSNEYTGRCFRRTSAALLADGGVNLSCLKRHGGWHTSAISEGFIEESIANKIKIAKMMDCGEASTSQLSSRNNEVSHVNADL